MSKKRRRLEIKVDPLPRPFQDETASCPVCGRTPPPSVGGSSRSCFDASRARWSSSATGAGLTSTRSRLFRNLGHVRRRVGRAALLGVLAGVATAAVAVAVRPRGGTGMLVDWDDVRSAARGHLDQPATSATQLAAAERRYRAMASRLEGPLLDFVGRLPASV